MWVLNEPDDSPYFLTTEPVEVKGILVPKGTKITYEKRWFRKKNEHKEPLDEKDITEIDFHEEATIKWAGVPITSIVKFFNPEMKGFSVYADFNRLQEEEQTQFSMMWKSCNDDLGITVENVNDWSFNKKNILDIESCSVNYQRYFSDDTNQQMYLDSLYHKMMNLK
ncbi:hypothetical protein GBO31_21420 [Aquimarina litoralis]|nr:hypothetical protein [Aquimarina litoralis]